MSDLNYLLDTNAMVDYINGNEDVKELIEQADGIYLCSVALGEAFFGAEKSAKSDENRQKIEVLITDKTILNCEVDTARIYGRVWNALRQKGRPIPQNDVWIAAIALQHDLTLLTRDKHFSEVDNLERVGW